MRPSTVGKAMLFVPSVLWMAVIFYLSSQSSVPNPTTLSAELVAVAGHLVSFGILMALFWFATGSFDRSVNHRLVIAFVATAAYGVVDEIHQLFVPGRTATSFDVATDMLGALIVAVTIILVHKLRVRPGSI